MIKSFSILFLIFLHHTYASPGDPSHGYEPLLKLLNNISPMLKTFPFKDIQSRQDEVVEKYLCPPETDEGFAILEDASKHNYKLKYCLFQKKFQENEDRICKKEVNFLFHKIHNRQENGWCGPLPYQHAYAFSYYDCKELSILNYLQDLTNKNDPQSYEINGTQTFQHEFCYDTAGKFVAWAQHYIRTPQLFQNPYFKNQQPLPVSEISTTPYFMNSDLFITLKDRYEMEKQKNTSIPGTFIMVPQPIVPPDHYALPIMKKSTHHYINMIPLWEKLVPLMTAIDQGIKQAQINVEKSDPESFESFVIQTNVDLPDGIERDHNTWLNFQLFLGNIWHKFIYQQKLQQGILITIHNTPENPPKSGRGCIVGEEKKCDFKTWAENEELRERITSEDTKYAFCCEIEASDLIGILPDEIEIHDYLNIDYLINESDNSISTAD